MFQWLICFYKLVISYKEHTLGDRDEDDLAQFKKMNMERYIYIMGLGS